MADTPTPEAQKVSHEIWDDYITGIAEGKFSERVAAREAIALALDRFAAARVEAERERLAADLREPDETLRRNLRDNLDAAQSALAECRQDRDHYRAKAYELGDAEGKLKDELAAAQVEVARLKERWQAACEQSVETAMEAATARAELSRLRATAARKGDREMAEKQVGKIGFDARNSSGDAFMDRANELADVIATARAQGHAAGVREGIKMAAADGGGRR